MGPLDERVLRDQVIEARETGAKSGRVMRQEETNLRGAND